MEFLLYSLLMLSVAANLASAAYLLVAIWRVNRFRQQTRIAGTFRPPVTILKPVCGLDSGLYENLRSFCVQDYPEYQVIFGVRDAADPAVPVIRRLMEEFPLVDTELLVDENVAGPNLKVSNLANMYRLAKYPYFVVADSDMRVDRQYASSVIAPFENSQVGVVTCLYSGSFTGGIASRLASLFINEWFLPSVLVSAGLSEIRFGLGATIAVRRELLERIGGFKGLSQFLADDHMLGRLVSEHGYKVVLSDYVVENVVAEKNLRELFRHELRWARTVRTVEPWGHAFSFLMYGVPLSIFGAVMVESTFDWESFEVLFLTIPIVLRGWLHFAVSRKLGLKSGRASLWLLPVRDILCFLVWCVSFLGRDINWRGRQFKVNHHGHIVPAEGL